jgi:hypothetical protein
MQPHRHLLQKLNIYAHAHAHTLIHSQNTCVCACVRVYCAGKFIMMIKSVVKLNFQGWF